MTTNSRTRLRVPRLAAAAVAATLITGLVAGTTGVAQANPGDGGPGGNVGAGEVWVTSSTTVAKGQKLTFAGEGFQLGTSGVAQALNAKWDAFSSERSYTGTDSKGAGGSIGTQFQVQGDGTVSGSVTVPADLDDPTVNGTANGPHFLRFLAGTPALSRWTDDVTLDAAHAAAPTVTATAATTSSRGTNAVTVTVTGSGFAAGEDVSVRRAQADATDFLNWTITGGTATTIKADAEGKLSGKIVLGFGVLRAGEHQLVFEHSADTANPATAQVTVANHAALANVALGSTGTITVSNNFEGATFNSLKVDPDPAVDGDEVEVLTEPITANAAGVATGTFTIPDEIKLLGTKSFVLGRSKPTVATQTIASQKVSPSSAPLNAADFEVKETAASIEAGLYQSAYSAATNSLFVTTASVTATSTLYRLDADTLDVLDSTVPAEQSPGKKWAAYGVGVDDENGTVWVSNTRQNTVAVYRQSDLSLIKQFDANVLTHTRDIVVDAAEDVVYISSASEGSSGQGAIGVFEANDKDGDGTPYEFIRNIAVYDRTEFSPVSLELDTASRKLFSPSLTSNKVAVVDLDGVDFTQTTPVAAADAGYADYKASANADVTLLTFDDLTVGGRGASGIAYDHESKHLFIASQNSDEVLVAEVAEDGKSATTIKEIATGAGALNVAFDPINKVAYVANFGGTTVTVLDVNGNRVANLNITRPNHVAEDGKGSVYAVDKDTDNKVYKISPKNPVLAGESKVGQTYSATPALDLDVDPTAVASFQWQVDGTDVSGATSQYYTATAADLGKTVSVVVTVTGATPRTTTLTATTPVAVGELKVAPKVTGTPAIGETLTATAGVVAEGATVSYQWLSNGAPIAGATSETFTVTPAQAGTSVQVTVTVAAPGYTDATKTTAALEVPLGTLTAATPKVTGTVTVGKTLTAVPGTWTAGTTLTYQWKANGANIAGATAKTLVLKAAQLNKKITVTVSGTATGYVAATQTSAATAAVKAATLTSVKPKVTGTAKVGKTLKVTAGAWTKGTKFTYQWTANGKAIKGATKASLKLTKALKGKKVVAKVTGKLAGYTTVTKASAAKKVS